jgi:hypothetical protein
MLKRVHDLLEVCYKSIAIVLSGDKYATRMFWRRGVGTCQTAGRRRWRSHPHPGKISRVSRFSMVRSIRRLETGGGERGKGGVRAERMLVG